MQQLPLELVIPAPASLANFVAGPNGEALALMQTLAAGQRPVSPILLWGPPGSGKSHLIGALPGALALQPGSLPGPGELAGRDLLTLDDLESWPEPALADLFLLLNRLRALPGHVLVIGARQPPGGMSLREDLRSRLAAGLVLALRAPDDDDLARMLRQMLAARGLPRNEGVVQRLLTRHRRDIRYLGALIEALDRYALARSRALTVPLLREFEQSDGLGEVD